VNNTGTKQHFEEKKDGDNAACLKYLKCLSGG
jgi:hypothetical protein